MSLETVKEGDLLIISSGFYEKQIAKVSKRTKTQILIGNERFNLAGRKIGQSAYYRTSIWIPKEGEIGEIRRRNARAAICRTLQDKISSDQLSDQQLIKIRDIIKEQPPCPA